MPQVLSYVITDPTDSEIYWDVQTNGSTDATIGAGGVVMLASASVGAVTISLPSAVGNIDRIIVVKKTDGTSNAVNINPSGSETIDGAASESITTQYASITMVSDGSNWLII